MPSSSLLASLGHPDLSSASTPSKLTTRNNFDGKEKQRLLRQSRKLSQILGELPHATVAPAVLVRGNPAVELPTTGFSQLHVPSSGRSFTEPSPRTPRFSHIFHTVAKSTMPSPPPSVVHDDSNRTRPKRLSSIISAPINQVDMTRFSLRRRQSSKETNSAHSDENASHTDHRSLAAETETLSDSCNLHSNNTGPRNKARCRSVYNSSPAELDARPRRSEDSSTISSKRGVSLWTKRRASNENQRHNLAEQSQGGITSEMYPPLTESQRITSIRRGRKLAQVGVARHPSAKPLMFLSQVFGTVPPIALYCNPPRVEDEPATSDTVQRERAKAYLALSSGDFCSVTSGCSSRHRSHSSLSQTSTVTVSISHCNDAESSREIESDQTSSHLLSDPDDDPDSTAQGSQDQPEPEDAAFRRRRLRAAKLSRFFGVTYNDLTVPIRQNDRVGVKPQGAEVDVRIDGPGWFWNRADSNYTYSSEGGAQDTDMNDVIALLRQMPRA
jgi:hypothetical protein